MSARDRDWWPAADAVARLGHAVTILDPEADEDVEHLWDQNPEHGIITVASAPTLLGWQLIASEETVQLDAAVIEALDDLAGLQVAQLAEDDGEVD